MLVMMTTVRPGGVSYLADALASVDAQRSPSTQATLLSDGPLGGNPAATNWTIVSIPKRSHAHALWAAMNLARRADEDLLLLEDDIELAAGALDRMLGFKVPDDVALVQFHGQLAGPRAPLGLLRPCIGASPTLLQALKFSRCALDVLLSEPPRSVEPSQALASVFRSRRLSYAGHVPDLVRHRGVVSTYGHSIPIDRFQGTTWPGEGFDARSLSARDAAGDYS